MLSTRFGTVPRKLFVEGYVTRWKSEMYSLGSYTFISVGATGEDYDLIAEPCLNGSLLFCGEATQRMHPGA